jgi:spermidine/putrescine transport system permease protein
LESRKENRNVFWTFAAPGTFWLLAFFVIPLAFLFFMSFGEKAVIDGQVSITEIDITGTLSNYLRAFDPVFLKIIWKSIWVSALATALCLATAYPIAFGICFAPPKWKPLLLLLVILPFWINLLIRTYALGPFDMLNNDFAVITGLVYVYMPFMVLPLYATIERLDRSFLEASLDLGASQFQTFMKVTVPLTMPGIISGIILVFIPCLGSFLTPDLLGGTDSQMIGNVIERQFKSANDWPFGAALSFLLMYATFGALALRWLFSRNSKGVDV